MKNSKECLIVEKSSKQEKAQSQNKFKAQSSKPEATSRLFLSAFILQLSTFNFHPSAFSIQLSDFY
jgi:hypothetical protein